MVYVVTSRFEIPYKKLNYKTFTASDTWPPILAYFGIADTSVENMHILFLNIDG